MTRRLLWLGLVLSGVGCQPLPPNINPPDLPDPEICADAQDNDKDGLIDCADPDCALEAACLGPFSLEARILLTPRNALALETNLPALVPDCLDLPFAGAPCDDQDRDGLVDLWETLILERFQPLSRFDEDEALFDDPTAVLGNVGRVALASQSPLRVHVFIMLGYSRDYGSCGFTSHNGDSERVALNLAGVEGGGPGDVEVVEVYTAAHEGTSNDHSQIFSGEQLSALQYTLDPDTAEPRWVVFPSQNKHATYANISICENISPIPCLDEDCGPDGVDPAGFEVLPPVVNAGEDDARLINDLGFLGFPGETAWGGEDFCGGRGGSGCSSPVREKLLDDPFGFF